ncbi:MAG: hypothetical protein ABJP45_02470 [Cyclobacteriaceae bacterium]
MNQLKDVKKIGKQMDKDKVDKWVKKYQKNNPDGAFGWLYGCDILETLLKYENSCGIWFFKGINDDGKERLVLYAADKDGNILDDKMKSLGAMSGGNSKNPPPADDGESCPPYCPSGD